MTVSAQTPVNRSTGNGVTTVFPYQFKIISSADIEVTVDDVVQTLNVDYTVSGAGVDAGGNVTMTTAPANLTTVVRRRNMALVRTTDYQDQGTLPAATLDSDIDATVLMVQQLDERLDRTFSLPASFSGDSTLPAPQAGYLLGWDATAENLTNIPATIGTSLVDLAASSGSSLVGFIQSGAGSVSSTVQAKLRESVSVKDFGAVGDGTTNDTAAFVLAFVSGSTHRTIEIPAGTYLLTQELYLGIYKRLKGAGRDVSTLKFNMTAANGAALLVDQYCSIEGLTIQNVGTNITTSIGICSYTPTVSNGWANGALKDCKIQGFGYGIGSATSTPATQQIARSQAFNTRICGNIFDACNVPIQLGLGANNISIRGNWFTGTTGPYNIWLGESYLPVIDADNAFQGSGSYDIHLLSCWSPKVSGYFEPAKGIYADSCPSLDVSNCILVGQSLTAATNDAFVRTNAATNAYGYPTPIRSRVRNITLDGSGSGKYVALNDANAETLTDNCVCRSNDWTVNGTGSYPEFEEGTFTATLSAAGGAPGAYTDQYGFYQQRGKQMSVSFRVGAAKGTMSGAVSIAGLPKAATSRTLYYATASLAEAPVLTLAAGYTQVAGEIGASSSSIVLTKIANNGGSAAYVLASEMGASPFFVGSIVYEVA